MNAFLRLKAVGFGSHKKTNRVVNVGQTTVKPRHIFARPGAQSGAVDGDIWSFYGDMMAFYGRYAVGVFAIDDKLLQLPLSRSSAGARRGDGGIGCFSSASRKLRRAGGGVAAAGRMDRRAGG